MDTGASQSNIGNMSHTSPVTHQSNIDIHNHKNNLQPQIIFIFNTVWQFLLLSGGLGVDQNIATKRSAWVRVTSFATPAGPVDIFWRWVPNCKNTFELHHLRAEWCRHTEAGQQQHWHWSLAPWALGDIWPGVRCGWTLVTDHHTIGEARTVSIFYTFM